MESISDISLLKSTTESANGVQPAKRPVRSLIVILAWANALLAPLTAPIAASLHTQDGNPNMLIAIFGVVGAFVVAKSLQELAEWKG